MASRTYVCLALLALVATSAVAQEEKDQCQMCKDLVNATRQVCARQWDRALRVGARTDARGMMLDHT